MRVLAILTACVLALLLAGHMAVRAGRGGPPPYLACAERRVAAFGSGHTSASIAEFSAIVGWMDKAAELGPRFDDWALAQKRSMRCRRVGRTPYLQCQVGALPCRPKGIEDANASGG